MLVPSRYCETINIGIRLDAFETTSFPWMLSVIANPIVLKILFSLSLVFFFDILTIATLSMISTVNWQPLLRWLLSIYRIIFDLIISARVIYFVEIFSWYLTLVSIFPLFIHHYWNFLLPYFYLISGCLWICNEMVFLIFSPFFNHTLKMSKSLFWSKEEFKETLKTN